MADKLDWLNQHFLMLKYNTLEEVIREGGYELPAQLGKMASPGISVQDFVFRLCDHGILEEAIRVLAYAIHHRAGVWWGLVAVRDLYAELEEGKKKAAEDAAKQEEAEKQAAAQEAEQRKAEEQAQAEAEAEDRAAEEKALKEAEEQAQEYEKQLAEVKANFTPEQKDMYQMIMDKVREVCKEQTGKTWEEISALANDVPEEEPEVETPEPEEEMPEEEADPTAMPQEMADELNKAAIQAVDAWVREPDAENTVAVLNASEKASGEIESMLASTAFWSYGNLSVEDAAEKVTPVPPGLAGNGLSISMLIMSLAEGGFNTQKQRMERYLKLGYEVAIGRSNWTVGMPSDPGQGVGSDAEPQNEQDVTYQKWS